jgi:glutamine synthetase
MNTRSESSLFEISRQQVRKFNYPTDTNGEKLKVSQFYGEYTFNFLESNALTDKDKKEISSAIDENSTLTTDLAEKYANAVLRWATNKGATHFCHWFQPLTGSTAEKHDAFLSMDNEKPIEKLSPGQLMQGEPDASSFPNGGSRSTFEARGYTTWDLTSPIFIRSSANGNTLCIPTAFISYTGEALDIKTPHLRSLNYLSTVATEFLNITNPDLTEANTVKSVSVSVGCEQEYFLVDRYYYFQRPDLVMSGRTVFGSATTRNQQLDDHYFGTIPERVLSYMQEVEVELYKLGIPAKTRHNEVAPGQFELAPIFKDSNTAADQNQLVMATLKSVAEKHDFVCLLHEKPFPGINGSGKHVNWSICDDRGNNLLNPTSNPEENYRFLTVVAIVCETIKRHQELIRMSIASHGNDHRLGANEAPPSIMSVFLGDTLTAILESMVKGEEYNGSGDQTLDVGVSQLAELLKDNTDRNRTSPFAFTGNKFEFRAVGSSASIGFPLAILNTAVADVISEVNTKIKAAKEAGTNVSEILKNIATEYYKNAQNVVFNGDGYSQEWVEEAQKRGLANLRTTAEAIQTMVDPKLTGFLEEANVYSKNELEMRYNVLQERYIMHREIELSTMITMIDQHVFPAAARYKAALAQTVSNLKAVGISADQEVTKLNQITTLVDSLTKGQIELNEKLNALTGEEKEVALKIAQDLMPLSEKVQDCCNDIEKTIPSSEWTIPTFYEMLFIR